ncbi:MAG: type III-B CRISPR module-associated protein Cmr5 [Thermogemmatispora sp.]|uniref:type III-B CRISPR module-associated protein Cmr5 n=1 Tax=Thermogemmatispora sp. TaxID=1968838 RepID=UPI00262E4FA8|nr:type III-B CRISPR module-associated protein Cmr5 [Thermogemmatispora sp.]MBX5458622.1 type III-B CRISPR module-associated protein Cmr5 [Thermogemmatispora sp.]
MREEKQPVRRLLEQERGKFAWNCVQEIKRHPSAELQAEYRTRALTFNQMVQINGLGATLGFLKAKAKKDQKAEKEQGEKQEQQELNAYGHLLKHLTCWMRQRGFVTNEDEKFDALLFWVLRKADREDYRRATTECLAFGDWLRRFAEAELSKEGSQQAAGPGQQGGRE